ncbi:hypothetical protein HPB52_001382 [Rhipicephalus sanguineus]|uniref:BPTI/Kunitz inhibitor domain-containing protein n=1 Tax=Rhipicephalus sanguineus TaxID=34632 RepID=A0A9D4PTS8_RHISA|nr:hypothetical protein HPB52_001382 [Rhipicephalus sanguineus]
MSSCHISPAGGPKKATPPSSALATPEASESSARQTDTVSSVSRTVGATSSFSATETRRSDTHASECSSLAPYWIPDQIKHYFRHRHSEENGDSSGKTDVALREIGLERELPAIEDTNSSRWARVKWFRNPRHALAAVVGVMTGALIALLLAAIVADFHITPPGSRSRAGRLAAPGDDSAAAQGEGMEAGHGDIVMPTRKRHNKETATPEDINTVLSPEGVEGNAACGLPAFRLCSGGPTEFYYNGTRQACMMATPDGAGVCNRGQNRFTSLESCRQRCVDSGEPAYECFEKPVFAECDARDVVDSWWWYLDGKGCRHWRFPRGLCPDGGEVFATSSECVRRCVDAKGREPPCVTPKGVVCEVQQLRFGYIADASPGGSAARRCRELPSAGGEVKVRHCLVGANKFPTFEACQRRCVYAQS